MNNKKIGSLIKNLRLERKLSQQKVATAIGVSFQQLQKYENGANRLGLDKALRLSDCFGVPLLCLIQSEPSISRSTNDAQEALQRYQLLKAFNQLPPEKRIESLKLLKAIQT